MSTAIVAVALAVAVVALVIVLLGQRATRARMRELTRRLDDARGALATSEADHADDVERLGQVRSALAAAGGPDAAATVANDEVPGADQSVSTDSADSPVSTGDGTAVAQASAAHAVPADPAPPPPPGRQAVAAADVLRSLWALTALERTRARRYADAVSTATPSGPRADGLAAGLEEEVGRLREETGTPGTLRVVLDTEPAPGDAELLLRATQALLAVLSRHCQGYDLYVHQWDQRLLAVLVCEGFDGPDSVADDTSEVLQALAAVDGRIELDRDPEGRLRARLSVPAASLASPA